MATDKTWSAHAIGSFVLAIVGIFFFYQLTIPPIVPIVAFLLGIESLAGFDPSREKGRWMGIVGLVLGGLYTLMPLW